METTLRTAITTTTVGTASTGAGIVPARTAPASPSGPARTEAVPGDRDKLAEARPAPRASTPAPARRSRPEWDTRLQANVASAQQAQDYLNQVARELESVKAALSAKLAGMKSGARELEARARQLGASIAARTARAGGSVDAQLEFSDGAPAQQRFRVQGLDAGMLQAAAPLSLAFSIGGAGGPQLAASIEPDMTPEQIAGRLDRTLAPLKVRAGLDGQGRIEFTTAETNWPAVRDSIAISGRGRVATEAVAPDMKLQDLEAGNPDALRQSLREVVQALERVRRSQAAASAALSAAAQRAAQPEMSADVLALTAQDFASTAASHDYDSLLAITSALVGVSRERVLALLGMR
ncbi:hypothetical protein [Massilia niabensis]|uniref:Flagellin n=1 Tax=Massilia niabensis TaxID=544910 RepID=A0ABW0KY21_9BURK